ncbi:hypothetical protein ACFWVT_01975 [Streptomyces cyaneofuscatus]|uniref:hypothetical protein n=1 Tax=Streptomyces griseus group TaxID=629295 RepID=UPI003660E81E
MSHSFDINDRTTWTWINQDDLEFAGFPQGAEFTIHPQHRNRFYQRGKDGAPYQQRCPDGLIYNPMKNVADHPEECTEDQVYAWAVSNGLVTDQR